MMNGGSNKKMAIGPCTSKTEIGLGLLRVAEITKCPVKCQLMSEEMKMTID